MSAVWQDLPALYKHFINCSHDPIRLPKERSKYNGLAKKFKHGFWFFLVEVAMLKDSLFVLMQLSLYFQSDKVSLVSAQLHIDVAPAEASCTEGKSFGLALLAEFFAAFAIDGKLKRGICC